MDKTDLHLINGEGQLVGEKALRDYLVGLVTTSVTREQPHNAQPSTPHDERQGSMLQQIGTDYHIVGIFGGQSSGKSTLLNHVFGSHFQTLEETVRRGQTTKGAFLTRADPSLLATAQTSKPPGDQSEAAAATAQIGSDEDEVAGAATTAPAPASKTATTLSDPPLLVVDFEGTDGLEHGDNQSFERQLSLFGLCMADTLIINMWAVDVGRFNAANISLLRTIFEVNLQLFSHESYVEEERPTLLVVVRDFVDSDPTPSLVTLAKSFDTIWSGITRSGKFAEAGIDALFQLKYYFLPHYKLQRPAFDTAIADLRHWFADANAADYLFRHRGMFRGVPLEGLPTYLASCWRAIQASKDLDIPTQREMLARHRCAAVQAEELATFDALCAHYRDRLDRGEVPRAMLAELESGLEARRQAYETQTRLYSPPVVREYGAQLEARLTAQLTALLRRLASLIANEVLIGMETRLQALMDNCVRRTIRAAQALPLVQATATTTTATELSRTDADAALLSAGTQSGSAATQPPTSYVVDDAGLRQITRAFYGCIADEAKALIDEAGAAPAAVNLYGRYSTLINDDAAVRLQTIATMTELLYTKLQGRLRAMADTAAETMHRAFETCLTHGPDGGVRFFATTKGLARAVPAAQQAGLALLDCLLYCRLQLLSTRPDGDDQATAAGAARRASSAACSGSTFAGDVMMAASAHPAHAARGPGEDGHAERALRGAVAAQCVLALRQSAEEEQFYLTFTTLETSPRYPRGGLVGADTTTATPHPPRAAHAVEASGVQADCVLLGAAAVQRAFEMYRQRCDFTTQLQLRTLEATRPRLPAWVIPALLLLGWNEIWYVLRSPLLLIVVAVIGFLFFREAVEQQWRALEEGGSPTMTFVLNTVRQYVRVAVAYWNAQVGNTRAVTPAGAQPATTPEASPVTAVREGGEQRHADPAASADAGTTVRHRHHHNSNKH